MKTQCNRTYRMQAKWGRKGIVPATAVNEGRRSHQQLQPPTGRRAAGPWGTQEGRNTCHPAAISRRRKWQPTPVFLPGESQGRRGLVGCRLWGCTESDTTEATQQQQQRQPPACPTTSSGTHSLRKLRRWDTAPWSQAAEVHVKGMASVGPDSCNFQLLLNC